jgi:predicted methyltransferase
MSLTKSLLILMFCLPAFDALCGESNSGNTAISNSINSNDRRAEDIPRDEGRQPGEVLEFFGIEPGMTVLDLFSGGGYYTEILSRVVGPDGNVIAHNNNAYMAYVKSELEERYSEGRLGNVTLLVVEANDLDLEDGSIDAALAILTWHDFYYVDTANNWPKIDAASMVQELCGALKPGGILGIVDHVAVAGSDPWESGQQLHRIDPERIKSDLKGDCFEFDGEIAVLRNSEDDYAVSMGDPSVRGKTDRVVYRFRRR